MDIKSFLKFNTVLILLFFLLYYELLVCSKNPWVLKGDVWGTSRSGYEMSSCTFKKNVILIFHA